MIPKNTYASRDDTLNLKIQLLGAPQITLAGAPLQGFVTRKAQALFIYLAMERRLHTRDALAAIFWGDVADSYARNSLRRVLPNLRDLVGDYLLIDRHTVAFNQGCPYSVDVDIFQQALSSLMVKANPQRDDLGEGERIVKLYQGDFLDGFSVRDAAAFEEWALLQREHLRMLIIRALTWLTDCYIARAEHEAGLATTKRLLTIEPWREAAHQQQMVLLAQSGQRTAALAQYEVCRTILADEFKAEPSAALTTLYEQIKAGSYAMPTSLSPVRAERAATSDRQSPADDLSAQPAGPPPESHIDWGDMPREVTLRGRQSELSQLTHWLLVDRCALVAILGGGGMGKTALAAQLVRSSARVTTGEPAFDRVIWRSLLNAPPLKFILRTWLEALSDYQITALPTALDDQMALLFEQLQRKRCLLVLDNVESILQAGEQAGHYHSNYEDYGLLFQRMGKSVHRSALLLTSREMPLEVARLERDYSLVRSLRLDGVAAAAGVEILQAAGLRVDKEALATLVQCYSGNPLALKLVAETVMDQYHSDPNAFLQHGTLIFDDIRSVLDQQFARLTVTERDLLIWLTIEREPVTVQQVQMNVAHALSRRSLLEVQRSLHRRSLLEHHVAAGEGDSDRAVKLSLQNVVMEYITDALIETMSAELESEELDKLLRYSLMKAQAKDYLRAAQLRLLLQPIAQRLLDRHRRNGVERKLKRLLLKLHTDAALTPGYGAANILHLALHLDLNMEGWDFSQLAIWQADLRYGRLPQVNFSQADFVNTAFLEKFDAVLGIAFSPDGRWLAAAGASCNIRLWQVADGQLLAILPGNERWLWAVAFSPDGNILASGGSDGLVHLWEVAQLHKDGAKVDEGHWAYYRLPGHTDAIFGLAYRPDGQGLASAGADHTIRLWDVAEMQHRQTLTGHTATVYRVAYSPSGRLLASASRDQTVRLWDGATGQCRQVLTGHQAMVASLCFSMDEQWLVTGSHDGAIQVWRMGSATHPNQPLAQRHHLIANVAREVSALALSPDGGVIASNGPNNTIRLWHTTSGELCRTFSGHRENIQALAFSPDGRILVSSAWDQTVRLWDTTTGYPLRTLQGYTNAVDALTLSANGKTLVSGNRDGTLGLWDLSTYALRQVQDGGVGAVLALAFHPTKQLMASSGAEGVVQLWSVDLAQIAPKQSLRGHQGDVFTLAFHPDGQLLASAGADRTVRLWDVERGRCHLILRDHQRIVQALAFSPDGTQLASGGEDGRICLWEKAPSADGSADPQNHAWAMRTLADRLGDIHSLVFSADGSLLACAGQDHTISLWQVADGRCLATWETPVHSTIYALTFHPCPTENQLQLASGSGEGTIYFWEVDLLHGQHRLRQMCKEHRGSVKALHFTPDGQFLISGSTDESIKIWDVTGGRCLETLCNQPPYVGMDISGATGLTSAQQSMLKALGAIDRLAPKI